MRAFWVVAIATGLVGLALVLAPFAKIHVPLGVIGGVVGTGVICSMLLWSRATSGVTESDDEASDRME